MRNPDIIENSDTPMVQETHRTEKTYLDTDFPFGSIMQTGSVGAPIFGKAANADGDWIVGDFAGRVSRVKI